MTENAQASAERTQRSLSRWLWAVLVSCAVLYALLYGPTVARATFLSDDWFHIEPIPRDRLAHLFYGDWHMGYRNVGGFYRPLPRLLMQLGRACFDLRAPGYLIFSASFHLLNCVLVWLVAMRLTRSPPYGGLVAWPAALVFAAYPTHHQALLMVSTFADPMATSGCLIALAGYLRVRESSSPAAWGVVWAGVLLAALSKESWATLPLIILLVEWIWRTGPQRLWPDRKAWFRVAGFVAFGIAYLAFRQSVLGRTGGYEREMSLSSVRQTFDGVSQLVIFPFADLADWSHLINVFSLFGGLVIVWAILGFPRFLLFAMGWMVLTTLPLLTLAPRLHDGGRLVYIVVVGWALFVGGTFEGLVRRGRTARARRAIGLITALAIAAPLAATHVRYSANWRRSFAENRRLVAEMVETAAKQPTADRFAILTWPQRFGVATSNRLETAAKALSTLAGIAPERVDALLAPDAPPGTLTFEVEEDLVLRVGRVEDVESWHWSGNRLEQWSPWGQARLLQAGDDGTRDYHFEHREAGLVSPDIAGRAGYYSVQIRYRPTRRYRRFIMWRGPGESFEPPRTATLQGLKRLGAEARLANLDGPSGLQGVLFLPAIARGTITVHSIEIARFEIGPVAPNPDP